MTTETDPRTDQDDGRNKNTHPLDSDIERNRGARLLWLVGYLIGSVALAFVLGFTLDGIFFENESMQSIFSTIVIVGIIAFAVASIEKLFIIRNPNTGMFVTIDQLRSLQGKDEVNVYYGPGTSISLPWETRSENNNISLEEAANEFEFEIQCSDGVLKGMGSYRMRPNPKKPITFLTGVAAVASDIEGLLIADILSELSDKTVTTALSEMKELNDHLKYEYNARDTESDVEKRFGVNITDVTVSKLLPSEDVQKTMSAITEAEAIRKGTEIILGMSKSMITRRLKDGTLTQADINLARDRFLSISGNLEGMEIKRSEFDVSIHGLDTEAIKSIADLAKTPGAQAAIAGQGRKAGGKTNKGGSKK
jgi:hypothetical protein